MATIVLLHGIDQQHLSADQLESAWIPALAGGVRIAGAHKLADDIASRKIAVRMAFYGHRFRDQAQGGASDPSDFAHDPLAEALAHEWLQRAQDSPRQSIRDSAQRELRALRRSGADEQGLGGLARSAIAALSHVPFFADIGMDFATRFLSQALGQVTAYFEDRELRTEILAQVLDMIDKDTRILIGHSLGSVVAYEAAHKLTSNLPLLLTLGSPIGLRNVVFDRLAPAPPSFPPQVAKWCNVADTEDFIAAVSDLGPLFAHGLRSGQEFRNHIVSNGARPHDSGPYLNSHETGAAVASALA